MKHLLFLIPFTLLSFKTDEPKKELQDQVIGIWVQTGYADKAYSFIRANQFDSKKPGIEFKKGGTLTKRQNAGWCGTPPISYRNDKGQWLRLPETDVLTIIYEFWGGSAKTKWEIIEITDDVMKAKVLEFNTEK